MKYEPAPDELKQSVLAVFNKTFEHLLSEVSVVSVSVEVEKPNQGIVTVKVKNAGYGDAGFRYGNEWGTYSVGGKPYFYDYWENGFSG